MRIHKSVTALIAMTSLLLCSCNNKATETSRDTVSDTKIVEEKKVSVTAEKIQEEEAGILYYVSDMIHVDTPATIELLANKENSGYQKFEDALMRNGIPSDYFSSHKELLDQINDSVFRSGMRYRFSNEAFLTSERIVVDGIQYKFGYYILSLCATTSIKYHVTYQEGNLSCQFDIWLPNGPSFIRMAKYETLDSYMADLMKYCLK